MVDILTAIDQPTTFPCHTSAIPRKQIPAHIYLDRQWIS
jgi:hypothetical protein